MTDAPTRWNSAVSSSVSFVPSHGLLQDQPLTQPGPCDRGVIHPFGVSPGTFGAGIRSEGLKIIAARHAESLNLMDPMSDSRRREQPRSKRESPGFIRGECQRRLLSDAKPYFPKTRTA